LNTINKKVEKNKVVMMVILVYVAFPPRSIEILNEIGQRMNHRSHKKINYLQ